MLSLRNSIENLPREHHIPALHALVANIGSPDALDDEDEVSDAIYIHLRTQLATLDGIGWISELIKDGVYEEELTKALLSHWRVVYKCLNMLWKKEVQGIWDTFEVAEGSHTRLAIYARVMDTYLMPRDLARIVLRNTTVLDFVFGMWLWESEFPTKHLDFWVSAALNNCFQFEGRPGDVFLARVLELAGDARRVARYATTRLRVAFKYMDKHTELQIIHDLDVACTLCFNDAMRSEILGLNGEPVVTKIALKVSEMVKDLAVVQRNEELMNVGCVIYVCFRFLNMTMDSEGGYVWICQALKAGLLQIIVNVCPRLTTLNLPMDPSLTTFIKHTLGDLLPRFLMFKSVINAVILATKQLKLDEITEHVYSDKELPTFWDFYGRVVLDRLVTKLVFNHFSSGVYGSFCDNVSVNLIITCTVTLIQFSIFLVCQIASKGHCSYVFWLPYGALLSKRLPEKIMERRKAPRAVQKSWSYVLNIIYTFFIHMNISAGKNRASLFKFKHQRFIHMLAVMTIQRHSPALRKHLLRRHDPGYVFPGVAGIIVNFEKAPAKIDVQSGESAFCSIPVHKIVMTSILQERLLMGLFSLSG